eukprot:m.145518 g.145518  ORF g.145518 m.145518 type:complete len:468 (+) comp10079_c1_seq2:3-1406(+)
MEGVEPGALQSLLGDLSMEMPPNQMGDLFPTGSDEELIDFIQSHLTPPTSPPEGSTRLAPGPTPLDLEALLQMPFPQQPQMTSQAPPGAPLLSSPEQSFMPLHADVSSPPTVTAWPSPASSGAVGTPGAVSSISSPPSSSSSPPAPYTTSRVSTAEAASSAGAARAKRPRRAQVKAEPLTPEEEQLRKQRRMLKNRESASASRRRKKEQLERLQQDNDDKEKMLAQARDRINELEKENHNLRQEVQQLRSACGKSVGDWRPKPTLAAGTFAMMCFVCVGLFATPMMRQTPVSPVHAHGRALQSLPHYRSDDASITKALVPFGNRAVASPRQPQSPVQVRTEEEQALDEWMQKHREKLQAQQAPRVIQPQANMTELELFRKDRLPIFQFDDATRPTLLSAVPMERDTTYLFCSEVQLVSPVSENNDHKLSIVMPAPSRSNNGSVVPTSTIMQIDCNVHNSGILSSINN